jgi:hypothetical protein
MLALMAFLAAPAAAQSTAPPAKQPPTIVHGVDVFQTSTGKPTKADFAANPIPAGFFCTGSAPFKGQVELKGVPLTTEPAGVTANGDTIVERLKDGVFSGGSATIPVIVRVLQLTSTSPLSIDCPGQGATRWRVDACLCGPQKTTEIVVKVDQDCGCGHFNGTLQLNTCLRFTQVDTGRVAGPFRQAVKLRVAEMPWCPRPGPGEPVINNRFSVDADCDKKPDLKLPKTTNFFPGWTCKNQAVDCMTQYADLTRCHAGPTKDHPHCVNPICKRRG